MFWVEKLSAAELSFVYRCYEEYGSLRQLFLAAGTTITNT